MTYLKCLLIYIVIACITGVVDAIFNLSFKKDMLFPIIVRILVSFGLGGYCIYYLLNFYI